ncbi:MAG TPA: YkgJ family cysteine cluster protein [Candidatus Binatia bacterium]|jgi:Fe-S-cluster containining protein
MKGHEDIEKIYADAEASLPARNCTRTTRCCRFAETGREPYVTRAETDYLFAVLRSQGRRMPPPRDDRACPFLASDQKTCTVYEGRPFGCRTHFCREAGGAISASELKPSLDRLAALDEVLGGDGPRPLTRVLNEIARAAVPRLRRRPWVRR